MAGHAEFCGNRLDRIEGFGVVPVVDAGVTADDDEVVGLPGPVGRYPGLQGPGEVLLEIEPKVERRFVDAVGVLAFGRGVGTDLECAAGTRNQGLGLTDHGLDRRDLYHPGHIAVWKPIFLGRPVDAAEYEG